MTFLKGRTDLPVHLVHHTGTIIRFRPSQLAFLPGVPCECSLQFPDGTSGSGSFRPHPQNPYIAGRDVVSWIRGHVTWGDRRNAIARQRGPGAALEIVLSPAEEVAEAEVVGGGPSEAAGLEAHHGPGGFREDAASRMAVEQVAMEVAAGYFAGRGYRVSDVSSTEPFDLLCVSEPDIVHVEVKGTTGESGRVIVTRNEVIHAREAGEGGYRSVLFVLAEIRIRTRAAGGVEAVGGTIDIIDPWEPTQDHLEPISFFFRW